MYFKNDAEISLLVRAFETCELDPTNFRHYQHLAVALWYLRHFPYAEASQKMCAGIKRLAAAHGKMGYHETITLFWVQMVCSFEAKRDSSETMCESANRLAAEFGNKNLVAEYYSEETLNSPRAKTEWVEPDLKLWSSIV